MAIITLERIPSQALSVTIAGRRFDIRLLDLGNGMAADIAINGVSVLRGQRLVAGAPFLPYHYLEAGNLILVTDGAEPDWRAFGITQTLVTLDEAGDPVASFVPNGGGGGGGPPIPVPGSYLEKARNLSDLTDVAVALVNLGVYSQAQVDALLTGFLLADLNLSDLTDFAAARANLSVYSKASVDSLLGGFLQTALNLSDVPDDATARTNLGLAIGSDVQAYDPDLAAIAALTTTAFGRSLLTLADAAALKTAAGVPVKATGSELRALTDDAKFLTAKSVADAAALVTLTDASTIAVDLATFTNGVVTLAGNRTLGAPTNAKPGTTGTILIKQDATGSRTLAYASAWVPFGSTPALSTAANAVDLLTWIVETSGKVRFTLAKGGAA